MLQILLPFLGTVLDKIFPDAQQSAEAKQKLIEMQINGELQALVGQLEINKAEASSGSAYAAGWRPTIGYVCAAALAFSYLINPLLTWAAAFFPHAGIVPPAIGIDDHLWELMAGMLGLAGWRTMDKIKGAG